MTLAPDTADLEAPDRSNGPPSRKAAGLPVTVWVLIVFGLVCVLAGIAVAVYGPRLWPVRRLAPVPSSSAPLSASAPAVLAVARQRLAVGIADRAAVPRDASALQDRVSSLERVQARTVEAAAGALTAASLSAAAQESRSFETEATAAERALPLSADVRALSRLAARGAPSRAALQAGFADAAARAAIALRDPGQQAGLPARLLHALSSIISIRRVDATAGAGFDATLARAEQHVAAGDLESALTALDGLPANSQAAFTAWRAGAERRVEIDRRIAAMRGAAMDDLARAMRDRP